MRINVKKYICNKNIKKVKIQEKVTQKMLNIACEVQSKISKIIQKNVVSTFNINAGAFFLFIKI